MLIWFMWKEYFRRNYERSCACFSCLSKWKKLKGGQKFSFSTLLHFPWELLLKISAVWILQEQPKNWYHSQIQKEHEGSTNLKDFIIKTVTKSKIYTEQKLKLWNINQTSYRPCNGLASLPGRRRNAPSRFMALKQEIRSGLMGHVARFQTLPTYLHIYLNYWKRIVVLIQQSRTAENAGNCC